jgi:DNA ligase-1
LETFSKLFHNIDETTSTLEKVRVLKTYFQEEDRKNSVWALYLLMGRARKRTVTSKVLRDYFLKLSGLPEWLVEECYFHVGDSAEAITLLLRNTKFETGQSQSVPAPIPVHLHRWLEERVPALKLMDEEKRRDQIWGWWAELDEKQTFVLNKVLTGSFRVGVSDKLVVRSLSQAIGVPEQVLAHRLMGQWKPDAEFFSKLVSHADDELPLSQPYPFFLAYPLQNEKDVTRNISRWQAEWKWDGIRAQVIRREGQLFIWSRGEDLITDQFPELAKDFGKIPNGTVLDGEIVAWSRGKPLSFNHLQKRLGRKNVSGRDMRETPVHLVAYDLLEHEGEDIRSKSLIERQSLLKEVIKISGCRYLHISAPFLVKSREGLKAKRENARERGVEGLMLKDMSSSYGVGRRKGFWWKYKVDPFSLDAVLIYAQAGSGKRASLFTDYTFALWKDDELVPFAKAYSGLSNAEIGELDRWIRRNTIERFGPVRSVRPCHVFEIGFDGISLSRRHKSGVAVRFPRILRWRRDKKYPEADTVQSARDLIK